MTCPSNFPPLRLFGWLLVFSLALTLWGCDTSLDAPAEDLPGSASGDTDGTEVPSDRTGDDADSTTPPADDVTDSRDGNDSDAQDIAPPDVTDSGDPGDSDATVDADTGESDGTADADTGDADTGESDGTADAGDADTGESDGTADADTDGTSEPPDITGRECIDDTDCDLEGFRCDLGAGCVRNGRDCTTASDCTPNERCTAQGCVVRTGCPRGCQLTCQRLDHEEVIGVQDQFGEVDCFVKPGEICADSRPFSGEFITSDYEECIGSAYGCILIGVAGDLNPDQSVQTVREFRCSAVGDECSDTDVCSAGDPNVLILECRDGHTFGVDCRAGGSYDFIGQVEDSSCSTDQRACMGAMNALCASTEEHGRVFACDDEELVCNEFLPGLGTCRDSLSTDWHVLDFQCLEDELASLPLPQTCDPSASDQCPQGSVCAGDESGTRCLQACTTECLDFCPNGFCTPFGDGSGGFVQSNTGFYLGGCIDDTPGGTADSYESCEGGVLCTPGHFCVGNDHGGAHCMPRCDVTRTCTSVLGMVPECLQLNETGLNWGCSIPCADAASCPPGLVCINDRCM